MDKGNFADVNGLHLYYEIHGEGEPLLLLHGGYGTTDMFNPVRDGLAHGRQTIAVDLQGHGRTADIDRPLRFENIADDIGGLIDRLGFETVDLFGYSLGGGVALRTAIQYPLRIRKLVLVSTPFRQTDWYAEVREGMYSQTRPEAAEMLKHTPLYEDYARVAPRPGDWPVLVGKMGRLLSQEYDWSGEIGRIQAQTMIVYGDADSISPVHAAEFFELLGGGKQEGKWDGSGMPKARLAILPGTTHYTIFTSPLLAEVVRRFLQET